MGAGLVKIVVGLGVGLLLCLWILERTRPRFYLALRAHARGFRLAPSQEGVVWQELPHGCGPACAVMVLARLGYYQQTAAPPPGQPLDMLKLKLYLEEQGLQVAGYRTRDREALAKALRQKKAIILFLPARGARARPGVAPGSGPEAAGQQTARKIFRGIWKLRPGWAGSYGHWVVLEALEGGRATLVDPYLGRVSVDWPRLTERFAGEFLLIGKEEKGGG